MMPTLAPPSVLSAPQRRCQILLTLFQPGLTATTATFSELNGVDDDIASLDISETGQEILRYHQLTLTAGYDVATGLKVQCLTNVCVYFTGYDVVSVCVHHYYQPFHPRPEE